MAKSNSTKLSGHVKDETGNVYGKLTVVEYAGGAGPQQEASWFCHCECGQVTTVIGSSLRKGKTRSCGCLARRVNGHSASPEYYVWYTMRDRCYNPNNKDYKHYGGRGIKMCTRWYTSVLAFIEDIGIRPSKKHSIDRINNDGNYEPGNCRWATQREQGQNSRKARMLTYNGETMCMNAWTRKLGLSPNTIRNRINCGWSQNRIFASKK